MDSNDVNLLQAAFSAGELSPQLFGRSDLQKYALGAARLRNMIVDIRGGASSRPGTRFICEVADSTKRTRLIPFSFSTLQTYILEFGDHTLRVITNGGLVVDGGGNPYVVATPWASADLWRLRFTQSADVMTICHRNYPPYDLSRTGNSAWTLTEVTFGTSAAAPTITSVTAKLAGAGSTPQDGGNSTIYRYVVTAQIGSEESLPSAPAVVTNAAVMAVNGDEYMTVAWTPVAKADVYNIYRQEELPNGAPDPGSLYGLVGSTTGLTYEDRNGVPDFANGPPVIRNPFAGGAIEAIAVTNGGSGYSSATTVSVTDPTGKGFSGFPVVSGGVIISVVIQNGGWLYTAPVVAFADAGGGTGAEGGGTVAPDPTLAPQEGQNGGGEGGGEGGGGGE